LADIDKTILSLEKVFKIYDSVTELRFTGAESFLYPHICEMMEGVSKYKNQFTYAIAITNGTYIPSREILDTMKNLDYNFMVRVDNYGALSKKHDELLKILASEGVTTDDRNYHDEDQAYGGWVDFGDFDYKNYSKAELNNLYSSCRIPHDCVILKDDKLTNCCYATVADWLGVIPLLSREVIELNGKQTVSQMREAILSWRSSPLNACQYCNGFSVLNSKRIPAAEQI
jgi:hypothetical protein